MKRTLSAAAVIVILVFVGRAQEKVAPADSLLYDKAPEAVKFAQADYPDAAKKDSLEGTVWLKVKIDTLGAVSEVNVQKSDAEVFNQPAITAVKQWVFKPALLKGQPVAAFVAIPFKFKLKEDKSAPKDTTVKSVSARQPPAEDAPYEKLPEIVSQVPPQYPHNALASNLEGVVWVKMWIDEAGAVVEAKIAKTDNEIFNDAAIAAAKQWTFKPAQGQGGKPVAVWITVPFRFQTQ